MPAVRLQVSAHRLTVELLEFGPEGTKPVRDPPPRYPARQLCPLPPATLQPPPTPPLPLPRTTGCLVWLGRCGSRPSRCTRGARRSRCTLTPAAWQSPTRVTSSKLSHRKHTHRKHCTHLLPAFSYQPAPTVTQLRLTGRLTGDVSARLDTLGRSKPPTVSEPPARLSMLRRLWYRLQKLGLHT